MEHSIGHASEQSNEHLIEHSIEHLIEHSIEHSIEYPIFGFSAVHDPFLGNLTTNYDIAKID